MHGEPVLCYIRGEWAYFTTQPLEGQTGDDWDDAPYEHNAGCPYEPREGESWKILVLAFRGPFMAPDDGLTASPTLCVEDINLRKVIPWLRPEPGATHNLSIPAGTPLLEFIRLMRQGEGEVYLDHKTWQSLQPPRFYARASALRSKKGVGS